jgi:hypothetical protein
MSDTTFNVRDNLKNHFLGIKKGLTANLQGLYQYFADRNRSSITEHAIFYLYDCYIKF